MDSAQSLPHLKYHLPPFLNQYTGIKAHGYLFNGLPSSCTVTCMNRSPPPIWRRGGHLAVCGGQEIYSIHVYDLNRKKHFRRHLTAVLSIWDWMLETLKFPYISGSCDAHLGPSSPPSCYSCAGGLVGTQCALTPRLSALCAWCHLWCLTHSFSPEYLIWGDLLGAEC